jgi:ATP-binding cassette, subfamily B, bacterial
MTAREWIAPMRALGLGHYSVPRALGELWRAIWRVGPGLAMTVLGLTLVVAATGPLRLLALGSVVESVIDPFRSLGISLAVLASVAAAGAIGSALLTVPVKELGRRVDLHFGQRLITCVGRPLGTPHLEDPATRDKISTVQGVVSPGNTPGTCVAGYSSLLSVKLGALGNVAILCSFRWWLGIGTALGAMLIRRRILRTWFTASRTAGGDVPALRRSEYLRDLALEPAAAKEHRLFALGPLLLARHRSAWSDALEPVWRERRATLVRALWIDVAVVVLAGLAAAPIAFGLVSGEVTAARAVVLVGALTVIVALGGFVPDADFPIRYGCLTVPPLLELEAELAAPGPVPASGHMTPGRGEPPKRIDFASVGFTYPGTERPVLECLNLGIGAGTTVAIVGANGAGKTTIVRLLARLYEPSAGRITVDGVDLSDLDAARWRRSLAVIFQDFARYELTLRDNVSFGAHEIRHDTAAIESVAEQAGLTDIVARLPNGWDTPLSPRYRDGVDLSGGQWQKVALARALLAVRAGARVLVLDEPTANLDVRAEAEFYERFLDLAQATTTILVSHRFSTVRRADRICVVEHGRVTEDGDHDELLELGGTYARMFHKQSARFVGG